MRSLRYAVERHRRERAERALQEGEQYFRALIDNVSEIISVLEPDGTTRYVSPAMQCFLGYLPGSRIGRNAFELVHPEEVEEMLYIFRELLAEPGLVRTADCRMRRADGAWRAMQSVGVNLVDDPAVRGVIITLRDVTARMELEAEARTAEKMAAVERLAGGVAHDLNNILMAIRGTTGLILPELPANSALRPDLEEIDRATDRAAALTRQLLAFSGKQILQPAMIDLNAIVAGLERPLQREVGEKIRVLTELDTRLPPVRADPLQLEQVIRNLVLIARDAMPHGGTLTLATQRVNGTAAHEDGAIPPAFAELRVTDTGVGMSDAVRARLFEPFFTTKPQGKGVGLGLSAVFGIVQQSGGEITVTTAPGEGSSFAIRLPIAQEPARADSPSATRVPQSTTILLAEDEAAVRRIARRILERNGYRVLKAGNADEAVEIVKHDTGRIDLLLTDVIMPDGNGPELAVRVRKLRPGVPVVFMSGYTEDALRDAAPADAVLLQKPFDAAALLHIVQQQIQGSRA